MLARADAKSPETDGFRGLGTPAGNVGAGGTGGLLLGQDGMTGLT